MFLTCFDGSRGRCNVETIYWWLCKNETGYVTGCNLLKWFVLQFVVRFFSVFSPIERILQYSKKKNGNRFSEVLKLVECWYRTMNRDSTVFLIDVKITFLKHKPVFLKLVTYYRLVEWNKIEPVEFRCLTSDAQPLMNLIFCKQTGLYELVSFSEPV